MKKKILITGASGFIGRNLKEQLKDDYQISTPSHAELELLDKEAVLHCLKQNAFDVVIHCATWDAARNSRKDQTKVLPYNLRMFLNIARQHDLFGKMIYFGSGAEFDLRHYKLRMDEEYFGAYVPDDAYGLSKYAMLRYVRRIQNIYNLRLFGVFGKYEDWEIRFISNACCKAIWDLPITLKQNAIFDYLYIDDLVSMTRWFIENKPQYHVYNVCSGKEYELVALAQKVKVISGKNLAIIVKKEGIEKRYSGDNTRLQQELGGISLTPMDRAIECLYAWYAQNKDRIDRNKLLIDK